ncbi:MAG: PD40 domain-containing protein [Anaerolineae bacterium]|nr:PD40 domain-containing protein [Anaerolineae bacterium]
MIRKPLSRTTLIVVYILLTISIPALVLIVAYVLIMLGWGTGLIGDPPPPTYYAVAWNPNGKELIVAGKGLWLLSDAFQEQAHLKLPDTFGERVVTWSPDAQSIWVAMDGQVLEWDPQSQKLITVIDKSNKISSIDWSPDSQKLVTGTTNKSVQIWNASDRILLQTLAGHTTAVRVVTWNPQKLTEVASGDDSGDVKIWDIGRSVALHSIDSDARLITALAWSPDGRKIAIGDSNGIVKVFDVRSGQITFSTTQSKVGFIVDIAWNPANESVIAVAYSTSVYLWDIDSNTLLKTLNLGDRAVTSLSWNAINTTLAVAFIDSRISLWNTTTGNKLSEKRLEN